MTTDARREYSFIRFFVSAYENGAWAEGIHDQPDQKPKTGDKSGKAVDWTVKRKSDGKTLAIEHTIIEPFVGDKRDFAFFQAAFLEIEADESLAVPGRWIRVFVPVGILPNHSKKVVRNAIVQAVHRWIKANRLSLPDGDSEHRCIATIPGWPHFDITLNLKVVPLLPGPYAGTGLLNVRRQQVEDNLDQVVTKALREKVPKLANTNADKRILLLERQHMNLDPRRILNEIEKQMDMFPGLAQVDEIWVLETPLYDTAFGGNCLRFELYKNGTVVSSYDFNGEELMMKCEDGLC
jgi:hypothetical protein